MELLLLGVYYALIGVLVCVISMVIVCFVGIVCNKIDEKLDGEAGVFFSFFVFILCLLLVVLVLRMGIG